MAVIEFGPSPPCTMLIEVTDRSHVVNFLGRVHTIANLTHVPG